MDSIYSNNGTNKLVRSTIRIDSKCIQSILVNHSLDVAVEVALFVALMLLSVHQERAVALLILSSGVVDQFDLG